MSRCWARHGEAPFERCEREAGHDGLHEISQTWDDEACWEPTPPDLERIRMVPVVNLPMREDTPKQNSGRCHACGCLENEHGPNGCEAHSCRTWVP